MPGDVGQTKRGEGKKDSGFAAREGRLVCLSGGRCTIPFALSWLESADLEELVLVQGFESDAEAELMRWAPGNRGMVD